MAKREKSIRLHPKYGLNPTIPTCFFCGKEKNEIVLLGAAYDGEAPKHIGAMDKTPCEECKKWMERGVILISVRNTPPEHEQDNPYRTGGWVVVKDEAIPKMFCEKEAQDILTKRAVFLEDAVWDQFGLPREDIQPKPEEEVGDESVAARR